MFKKMAFFNCLFFIICVWLFTGCVSRRAVDTSILDYQRKISELERTIEQYDSVVKSAADELGSLQNRSERMEGDIDELIQLFDEYQQGVTRLIRNYYKIRNEIEDKIKDTSYFNNHYSNDDCLENNCIYFIFKERKNS